MPCAVSCSPTRTILSIVSLPSCLFSLYHPIYCFQWCPGWEKNLSGPIVWWNHRGCGVHITTAVTPAIAALMAATVALVAVAVTGRWLLLLAVRLAVRGSGEGVNCCRYRALYSYSTHYTHCAHTLLTILTVAGPWDRARHNE
jgi:hypothetical protein